MSALSQQMSVHRVHACRPQGQKRVSDPLGLELQTVVRCHVGVRD